MDKEQNNIKSDQIRKIHRPIGHSNIIISS